MSRPVILLRTHVFGERERMLMQELSAGGAYRAVVAADESRAPLDVGPVEKISVTRQTCESLGLYCPPDFTWRNGDYVLYLARHLFPEAPHFWLTEPDVEHSFPDFQGFFQQFEPLPELDVLAAWLRRADSDWYWHQTMPSHPTGIWRCLFATVRLSARAIDACLAARRRRSWALRDRLSWPNDEVFVATVAIRAGLEVADLNTPVGPVYEPETFGYQPIDGAASFRQAEPRIYHPVLHGQAYQARLARHAAAGDPRSVRWRRRLQRQLP